MHVTIETNGTVEGTTVKDGDSGELLGLVKSLSVTISKGGLERLSLTWDDSGAAKKRAAKQEKAVASEEQPAQPE